MEAVVDAKRLTFPFWRGSVDHNISRVVWSGVFFFFFFFYCF